MFKKLRTYLGGEANASKAVAMSTSGCSVAMNYNNQNQNPTVMEQVGQAFCETVEAGVDTVRSTVSGLRSWFSSKVETTMEAVSGSFEAGKEWFANMAVAVRDSFVPNNELEVTRGFGGNLSPDNEGRNEVAAFQKLASDPRVRTIKRRGDELLFFRDIDVTGSHQDARAYRGHGFDSGTGLGAYKVRVGGSINEAKPISNRNYHTDVEKIDVFGPGMELRTENTGYDSGMIGGLNEVSSSVDYTRSHSVSRLFGVSISQMISIHETNKYNQLNRDMLVAQLSGIVFGRKRNEVLECIDSLLASALRFDKELIDEMAIALNRIIGDVDTVNQVLRRVSKYEGVYGLTDKFVGESFVSGVSSTSIKVPVVEGPTLLGLGDLPVGLGEVSDSEIIEQDAFAMEADGTEAKVIPNTAVSAGFVVEGGMSMEALFGMVESLRDERDKLKAKRDQLEARVSWLEVENERLVTSCEFLKGKVAEQNNTIARLVDKEAFDEWGDTSLIPGSKPTDGELSEGQYGFVRSQHITEKGVRAIGRGDE